MRRSTYAAVIYSVYRRAVAFGSVGGWGGATNSAVCAALSIGSRPEFWSATEESRRECNQMIFARFESVLVVFEIVALAYVLFRISTWYVQHLLLVRPVMLEMRHLRGEIASINRPQASICSAKRQ